MCWPLAQRLISLSGRTLPENTFLIMPTGHESLLLCLLLSPSLLAILGNITASVQRQQKNRLVFPCVPPNHLRKH